MELSALLTSAGINIGACVLLFSLYSILRKQPSNKCVYFAGTLAQYRWKKQDPHWFDRYVPSPRWILNAWELTDEEILNIGGLDAVVFVKALVFSIRIFSIAAIICLALVLPLNYLGNEVQHKRIDAESLEVFTIQNLKKGSKWLWAHCLALCIISCSAWILLYFEYRSVTKLRLQCIRKSSNKPSLFTVVFRGIPRSSEEQYSSALTKYLKRYYPSDYLSHQMVYKCGKLVKLMRKAEEVYDYVQSNSQRFSKCGSCTRGADVFELSDERGIEKGECIDTNQEMQEMHLKGKESAAAFIFFKTRYAAASVARAIQTSNPMLWVTDPAPEPSDVYWSNLCIPYKQFWMRKIATLVATAAFMIFFLAPVTIVQSLANLPQLQKMFPFLRKLLEEKIVIQVVTGYLPSVILILFFYMVPPLMFLFSTVEGSISRSSRKRATCLKVLYFTIWNVFFVNLVSGTLINKLSIISNPQGIPAELSTRAVPALVKFFMTYVMTSGWTSLACELVQLYPLLSNTICRYILCKEGPFDEGWTFPFHTEVPRILLFGLLGFTFAVLSPLILPLLLIYFCLGYLVYKNQILNVYLFKYDTGGMYWPIIHDTTIFSLVLAQIMALGVFATKESPVCTGFTILLIICTLLYNEYCRQRFLPVFKDTAAEDLIDLDQQDDKDTRDKIYSNLENAYLQHNWVPYYDHEHRKHHRTESDINQPTDNSHHKPGNGKHIAGNKKSRLSVPPVFTPEQINPLSSEQKEVNHPIEGKLERPKLKPIKVSRSWPNSPLVLPKRGGLKFVQQNQMNQMLLPSTSGGASNLVDGRTEDVRPEVGGNIEEVSVSRQCTMEGAESVEGNQSSLVKEKTSKDSNL